MFESASSATRLCCRRRCSREREDAANWFRYAADVFVVRGRPSAHLERGFVSFVS